MATGVTKRLYQIDDIVAVLEAWEAKSRPSRPAVTSVLDRNGGIFRGR